MMSSSKLAGRPGLWHRLTVPATVPATAPKRRFHPGRTHSRIRDWKADQFANTNTSRPRFRDDRSEYIYFTPFCNDDGLGGGAGAGISSGSGSSNGNNTSSNNNTSGSSSSSSISHGAGNGTGNGTAGTVGKTAGIPLPTPEQLHKPQRRQRSWRNGPTMSTWPDNSDWGAEAEAETTYPIDLPEPFSLGPRAWARPGSDTAGAEAGADPDAGAEAGAEADTPSGPSSYPDAPKDFNTLAPAFEYTGRYIPPMGWQPHHNRPRHFADADQFYGRYPWMRDVDQSLTGAARLDAEIAAFAAHIRPTPTEAKAQRAVFDQVDTILSHALGRVHAAELDRIDQHRDLYGHDFDLQPPSIELTGSIVTGTAVATSDVDINIVLPDPPASIQDGWLKDPAEAAKPADPEPTPPDTGVATFTPIGTSDPTPAPPDHTTTPPSPFGPPIPTTLTRWRSPWIKAAFDALRRHPDFVVCILIPSRRFPRISAMHRRSGVSVQLSFLHHFLRTPGSAAGTADSNSNNNNNNNNNDSNDNDSNPFPAPASPAEPLPSTTYAVQHYTAAIPALFPAYAVLKAAFDIRGLTDVYRKGIPTYGLFMMAVAASIKGEHVCGRSVPAEESAESAETAETAETAAPTDADPESPLELAGQAPDPPLSPAQILLRFLTLYASFDTHNWGISIRPPIYFRKYRPDNLAELYANLPATAAPNLPISLRVMNPVYPYKLALVDPANPGNDLGFRTFSIKHIQRTVFAMCRQIKARLDTDQAVPLSEPLLEHLVGPTHELYQRRRRMLEDWYNEYIDETEHSQETRH